MEPVEPRTTMPLGLSIALLYEESLAHRNPRVALFVFGVALQREEECR